MKQWVLSIPTSKLEQETCAVNQDYDNDEDEFSEDQDASEAAGPNHAFSEEAEFVEDENVNTATGYGCANSKEEDVDDQDPREVDKENGNNGEDVQNADQQLTSQ